MFGSIDLHRNLLLMSLALTLAACGGSSSGGSDDGEEEEEEEEEVVETVNGSPVTGCDDPLTALSGQYQQYEMVSTNVTVVLAADGCTVTFESDGKPDHESPYWDPTGSNADLWIEAPDPDNFGDPGTNPSGGTATPGYIDSYTNDYDLLVSVSPQIADSPSDTHLGAIGIATSGTPIFNEQEGAVDLSGGVILSLDQSGAHTGPETYHYHLEPTYVSFDDDELVGIIADGFFLYGRKCYATADYPADLDDANGHTSTTQYSEGEEVYHYHITNEPYLDGSTYYLVFGGGSFSGTESVIE